MLNICRLCVLLAQPRLLLLPLPGGEAIETEREPLGELPLSLSDMTVESWELHWCGVLGII